MSSSTGQTQGTLGQTPGMQKGMQAGMGQSMTGTPDTVYNLVSILYHSLDGCSTMQKYIQDAQGDQELQQFFQQCQQQNKQLADKAKQLLASRLTSH